MSAADRRSMERIMRNVFTRNGKGKWTGKSVSRSYGKRAGSRGNVSAVCFSSENAAAERIVAQGRRTEVDAAEQDGSRPLARNEAPCPRVDAEGLGSSQRCPAQGLVERYAAEHLQLLDDRQRFVRRQAVGPQSDSNPCAPQGLDRRPGLPRYSRSTGDTAPSLAGRRTARRATRSLAARRTCRAPAAAACPAAPSRESALRASRIRRNRSLRARGGCARAEVPGPDTTPLRSGFP